MQLRRDTRFKIFIKLERSKQSVYAHFIGRNSCQGSSYSIAEFKFAIFSFPKCLVSMAVLSRQNISWHAHLRRFSIHAVKHCALCAFQENRTIEITKVLAVETSGAKFIRVKVTKQLSRLKCAIQRILLFL